MVKEEYQRYYVFDNADNKFIEDNGELAIVGEKFVNELHKEINVRFLTFVKKEDYDNFLRSKNKVKG